MPRSRAKRTISSTIRKYDAKPVRAMTSNSYFARSTYVSSNKPSVFRRSATSRFSRWSAWSISGMAACAIGNPVKLAIFSNRVNACISSCVNQSFISLGRRTCCPRFDTSSAESNSPAAIASIARNASTSSGFIYLVSGAGIN